VGLVRIAQTEDLKSLSFAGASPAIGTIFWWLHESAASLISHGGKGAQKDA